MQGEQTQTEETPEAAETEEQTPAEETPEQEASGESEEGSEGAESAEASKEGDEPDKDAKAAAAKAEQAKADEKHKRQGGWQRKIQRLEQELAAAKERELTVLRSGQNTQPPKPKTPEEQTAEYVEALVEKRLTEREVRQEQAKNQAEFQRRTAAVRAAHPDFDDVVMSVSDVPVSAAVQEALLTSEHGGEMMYQLATNPAELARISALPPLVAAREIGRLEAKFASSTAAPKTQTKSATRPPVPPTSVNGSSSTSTRKLDDLDMKSYKQAYRSGRR